MAKRYHPTRRRALIAGLLVAALAAALFAVREPLASLCRAHAELLFSGARGRFATADDRASWAARHPGELRVALVGRADDPRMSAFAAAVGRVNEKGGVGGRRIEAVRIDPSATPDGLQVALTRLAGDPSHFALFAALSADQLIAVKPIILQGRLLTFAPGVTNMRATCSDEIPYVFLPNTSDADIAADIAEEICRTDRPGLVFCHDETDEGRGLGEELQKAFQDRAMPSFIRIPLARDIRKSYTRAMIAQAHDFHGIDHVAYARADRIEDTESIRWLLATYPGKIVLSNMPDGDWTDAERARFVIPKSTPDPEAAAMKSVELFAEAVGRSPTLHPDAVIEALGPRFTERRFIR